MLAGYPRLGLAGMLGGAGAIGYGLLKQPGNAGDLMQGYLNRFSEDQRPSVQQVMRDQLEQRLPGYVNQVPSAQAQAAQQAIEEQMRVLQEQNLMQQAGGA